MKDRGSDFVPIHKHGIVVEVLDETLVYHKENHRAHCLNRTAAEVWKLCDGEKTVAEITETLVQESKSPVDEELVWLTLRRLSKAGLLVKQKRQEQILASRRAVMRKIGMAAMALPIVTSILVPTAEAAVSCSVTGEFCNPRPCCPGHICISIGPLIHTCT
jgi:hypothetical protein